MRSIVRLAAPEADALRRIVFARYPRWEWATFARFGWRETPEALVLTLALLDFAGAGDLDDQVGHVAIQESYTLRVALAAEAHPLAVGVVHSHPRDYLPQPSTIDDDMDTYYARYFADFAPGRPYVSLIFAELDHELVVSGRVYWRGAWSVVDRFAIERTPVRTWRDGLQPAPEDRERAARLTAAFGREATARLRGATVAVIGAGGTGSAAIEVLARAGVGTIIVVDPDQMSESNLERVHGSHPEHVGVRKVALAREHVRSIDPSCTIVGLVGALPQAAVVDQVVTADVVLGCTDQQHSRLALSDLALRFLVPAIDCGVVLEGEDGRVTGQVVQVVRFLASDPCALCRDMISATRVAEELMPDEERRLRQEAGRQALERGEDAGAYWRGLPQFNTVGYLTTVAGSLAAGYAIGWLTDRFDLPSSRLQMNLVAPYLDVVDPRDAPRAFCACRRVRGWADQARMDALVTAPSHWPPVNMLAD